MYRLYLPQQRVADHVAARAVEVQEIAALAGFDDLDARAQVLERPETAFHFFVIPSGFRREGSAVLPTAKAFFSNLFQPCRAAGPLTLGL